MVWLRLPLPPPHRHQLYQVISYRLRTRPPHQVSHVGWRPARQAHARHRSGRAVSRRRLPRRSSHSSWRTWRRAVRTILHPLHSGRGCVRIVIKRARSCQMKGRMWVGRAYSIGARVKAIGCLAAVKEAAVPAHGQAVVWAAVPNRAIPWFRWGMRRAHLRHHAQQITATTQACMRVVWRRALLRAWRLS